MTERGNRAREDADQISARTITPLGQPVGKHLAVDTNAGRLATEAWLFHRGLRPRDRKWDVEIGLGIAAKPATLEFEPARDTRFQLHLFAEEWGYRFCHSGRESWIRITDVPFVHGSDHFKLLGMTPPLKNLGAFLRVIEATYGLRFQRSHAAILSTIAGAEPAVREWVQSL